MPKASFGVRKCCRSRWFAMMQLRPHLVLQANCSQLQAVYDFMKSFPLCMRSIELSKMERLNKITSQTLAKNPFQSSYCSSFAGIIQFKAIYQTKLLSCLLYKMSFSRDANLAGHWFIWWNYTSFCSIPVLICMTRAPATGLPANEPSKPMSPSSQVHYHPARRARSKAEEGKHGSIPAHIMQKRLEEVGKTS